MEQPYSQWRAMWAICKSALRATFRSPQAVFFSLFFPIVLIAIFGALGGGGGISMDVAFDKRCDTINGIYHILKNIEVLDIKRGSQEDIEERLKKGKLTAIIDIQPIKNNTGKSQYDIHLKTSSAGQRDIPVLRSVLNEVVNNINTEPGVQASRYASISVEQVKGREYKMIDFYLPGMLGFSLIGSAVFGVAFLFFSLRETLVLKRMYSTPVRKGYIVLGESIARVLFQLTTAVVIILFGKFFYDFTLANGWVTFFDLLFLSFLGLLVFMGFGFVISSVSKTQNVIPIYANLFMFPQYFLSGTFFPKSALPQGMQSIIKVLPLTGLNDAMRKVSFEGAGLWDVKNEILLLLIWCIVIYAIAIRVFKWE
jgi:ABC-2 type transport system permease protein